MSLSGVTAMFTPKRKLLSQNFLCNRQLIKKLIERSFIGLNDTVLEIGAGDGIITEQLVKVAREVVAIELDSSFFQRLKERFSNVNNLKLTRGDFLDLNLPARPYKVFSNIPFSRTGDIVRKLLLSKHSPIDSYLVLQREAADKFIAKDRDNSMASILYFPWWEIKVIYKFQKSDFIPSPSVETVLVQIKRREVPFLTKDSKSLFFDFIADNFIKKRNSRNISPKRWINLFEKFVNDIDFRKLKSIRGAFARLQSQQSKLEKIHRTRINAERLIKSRRGAGS